MKYVTTHKDAAAYEQVKDQLAKPQVALVSDKLKCMSAEKNQD